MHIKFINEETEKLFLSIIPFILQVVESKKARLAFFKAHRLMITFYIFIIPGGWLPLLQCGWLVVLLRL